MTTTVRVDRAQTTLAFAVTVRWEDPFWVAVVDGVPGGATEVRRLPALDGEVRDLVSALLDVDPAALELRYDYQLVGGAGAALSAYATAKQALATATRTVEHEQVAVARELQAAGVSLRGSAVLMGLSHQRVQQILADQEDDTIAV